MRVLGGPHEKWKEKLSSFGTVKCGKEEQRERKTFLHLISH
jgi:hypothetical protein